MSQYEDIQRNLAGRAAQKISDERDREYTSWTPWLVPSATFSWTGPTIVTGTQYIPTGGVNPAAWQAAQYRFQWATPVFDLRPDLRAITEFPPNGVPIWNRNARLFIEVTYPWDSLGTGWITPPVTPGDPNQPVFHQFWGMHRDQTSATEYQIQTPSSTGAAAYDSVYSTTTWSPIMPQSMGSASPTGTAVAASDPRAIRLVFCPPGTEASHGTGSPLRYWKLVIWFVKNAWLDTASTTDAPWPYAAPMFTIRAGMY